MRSLLRAISAAAALFLVTTNAKSGRLLTKTRPLQGCEAASCPEQGKVCNVAQYGITRFGTAPGAIKVSGTQLSLTLADLASYQQITEPMAADTGYSYTDHTLFLGAPPDFNTTKQKDACALVLLYDFQKLVDDGERNNTTCGGAMARSPCFQLLAGIIRSARAPSNSTDRCAALALEVSRNFTASTSHFICGGFGSKFNVTGAPLLGRHASPAIHSSSGCSPVSPPEYKLHKGVDFGTIGPLRPSDSEDRHSSVPVVTVVFESDDDSEGADVQIMCLRSVAHTHSSTSAAVAAGDGRMRAAGLVALAAAVGAWCLLQEE